MNVRAFPLLSLLLPLAPALAAEPPPFPGPRLHLEHLLLLPAPPDALPPCLPGPCEDTAFFAWLAAEQEARADALFGMARCVNDGDALGPCLAARLQDYRDAVAAADVRRQARLDVCRLLGSGGHAPQIDPNDFRSTVDNPFWPLIPGRTMVYRKVTNEGTEVIRVTTRTATVTIDGVDCRLVRDVVRLDGELVEDTDDWYAQHRNGDVWYFGEIARNYEEGMLTDLDGSWRSGVDGARPGIVMPANPQPGQVYRQEFLLDEAEDLARVVSRDETVVVPAGTFCHCLQTEEWTPLEPGRSERKFYAPGVGLVLEVSPSGARTELVRVIAP